MKTLYLIPKVSLLLFLFIFELTGWSQTIEGDWYGMIKNPDATRRIVFHISDSAGKYKVILDSPDRDFFGTEVDLTYNHPDFELSNPERGVEYKGSLNEEFTSIQGTWTGNEPLVFKREIIEAPPLSLAHVRDNYDKREVYIPMRDGVRLFTSIYTPKDKSREYPILLSRTPYNSESRGEEYVSWRLEGWLRYVKEGYIIVLQDVRGRYMSEGTWMQIRPHNPKKKGNKDIDESSDTFDTIDWLVKNVDGNNEKVGVFGISYPGFYSTMSLPDAHPALKAVSPQAPVVDWFIGDDWHHNGAFLLMDAFNFMSSIERPRPEPTREWQQGFDYPIEDSYEFFLRMGPLKNAVARYFGDTLQFWNDMMNHPNYDDFWKARDPRPHLKNVKPAVMVVGGWFDAEDLFGPLQTYQAIETQNSEKTKNHLIMGPWFHGQWARPDGESLGNVFWGSNTSEHFQAKEMDFFNYYLKEKGDFSLPEATIFITGANRWEEFETWPPGNTTDGELYFHPNGSLSFEAPAVEESFDQYDSDPSRPIPYTEDVHLYRTREYMTDDQRFASRRPDVMVYQTGVLDHDITFTGPLTADLYVSTTGTDADYVVKLVDVFPDKLEDYPKNEKEVPMEGYQMLVRGEVFRGRFRKSFEQPEPLTPGQTTQVKFEIPDVAHTFKAGHKIMIQIQNSWFPLVDRNPQKFVDIYHCDENDFQKATHRVYHDRSRPSHVKVKILKPE